MLSKVSCTPIQENFQFGISLKHKHYFKLNFEVLHLCSLSNLYTPFTYPTVVFYFYFYIFLFAFILQQKVRNKNHLNKSYFM